MSTWPVERLRNLGPAEGTQLMAEARCNLQHVKVTIAFKSIEIHLNLLMSKMANPNSNGILLGHRCCCPWWKRWLQP